MNKLLLLLLLCICIFKAVGQPGSLDPAFANKGVQTTAFFPNLNLLHEQGRVVLTGANGAIFVVIYVNFSYTAVVKYLPDGRLDSSYGNAGFSHSASLDVTSAAMQGDKIIVAGFASDSNYESYDMVLARYTANGKLDTFFGQHGLVTTDFGGSFSNDVINAIALQGSKIVVAGTSNNDFALARYTDDGKLDATFGMNGRVTTDFGVYDDATSLAVQGDKILVVGSSIVPGFATDFALACYTANGVLDTSFGVNGSVTTDFDNSTDRATAIVLQGDKIVVAGYTYKENVYFALARYTADGAVDSTFGTHGKVTTNFDNLSDFANAVAIQGDKILVAGYNHNAEDANTDFLLARYTADGKVDSTFGEYGKVITGFSSDSKSHDHATSIAIQGNKIILAGYTTQDFSEDEFNEQIALARYTVNGKLDASFGHNGKVITGFGMDEERGYAIALQRDKIVVAGQTTDYEDDRSKFILVRYTNDGRLDASFGDQGRVTTNFNNSDNNYATAVTIEGNKIIVGGYTNNSGNSNFALARYTANGVLDASFGAKGKVITDVGSNNLLLDVTLDMSIHESSLYVVGSSSQSGGAKGVIAAYQLEAPEPTISITDVTISESKRYAIAKVYLSTPTNKVVRLHFTTRDKTAVHNADYLSISGPLFFIPGVNTTAKIIIPIVDDNNKEGDEQFEIILTNAHNATIRDSVGVVTIMDDDDALITKQNTSLRIHVSPNPSNDAFTVQLQGSNLKQSVSVQVYDVSGRLLEQKENISIGQTIRLGNQYKAGTYLIEAVQGSQSVQTTVIKVDK